MKKPILLSLFVMLSCMTMFAQSAITEGFYRVQNMASSRYLYVRDCTGDISTLGADMGAIELWLGQENTVSDPGSIMYFKNAGGAWDIQSQATGVYEMTAHYMTITTFNGGYVVYNSGQYLYDITKNNTNPRGRIGAKTDSEMKGYTSYKKWNVIPVNSSTDSYFGFKPTINANGSYYTTFFADFAFTPKSDNTKVWYVSNVDKQYGIAVIKPLTGTVKRSQPVIIQSTSSDPSNNRVDLTAAGGNAPTGNKLTGIYFSNGDRSYEPHPGNPAYVEWNAQTMRMLGKDASGKLAFINNPTDLVDTEIDPGTGKWRAAKVIPHNQAYLKVDADCPASLQVMTEAEYDAYLLTQRTFTLTYKVDGQVYKQYTLKAGDVITPEAAPTKVGHTFSGWDNVPATMPANDVVVNGSFKVNQYTLTYKVDGVVYKTYTLNYGASITAEAAPTKVGHTFSGWDNVPATMPANDVVVNGSFKVNQYTLTYKVDGAVYKTYTLNYGASITAEAAPTKVGHTFSGWDNVPATMPANDVVVNGSFKVNQYTLTYKVDGAVYKTYTMNYGASITAEPTPTKVGHTFSGWDNVPATMPANDVVVNGSFKVNQYILTYKVDGAVYKTYTLNYGASITAEAAPTKVGHTFSGWDNVPATMPAQDVIVSGSFTVNQYVLTYYVDGEVYKTQTLNYGDAITPEAEPTREGETFSGWSEIPETMPAHDVDVHGSFDTNTYILTYKVDGVVYKTFSLLFGAEIVPIDEPTREGYTFSGWSEIPETMPAHNVEVNGSFSINSYTLTYVVDGEVYKTLTIEYGAAIVVEDDPEREGFTFSGWSGVPAVMPAEDVIITGSFSVNYYTITYLYEGEELNRITLAFDEEIPEYSYQPESNVDVIYSFVEWQEDGVTFTLNRMPARDVVLTAIVESTPTGINNITSVSSRIIYDLQGRRVTIMKRGQMYIVNGRKYMHK